MTSEIQPSVSSGSTAARSTSSFRLPPVLKFIVRLWQNDAVRTPVLIFLALRILTILGTAYVLNRAPVQKPLWIQVAPDLVTTNQSAFTYEQSLGGNVALANLVAPWHRFDTAWYTKIAIQGYQRDNAIVFPPLYPMLMALLAPLLAGNYVLAGILVSNTACLIAFMLLYQLVREEFPQEGKGLAMRTLLALATFPTAYILMAAYTETVFLALTLGAFLAANRRHWWLVGILAFLAGLCRLQGAFLALPMAWIAYVQLRERGWAAIAGRLPAVIGAPLGTASYLAYLAINDLGSINVAIRNEWHLLTMPPWESVRVFLLRMVSIPLFNWEQDNGFTLLILTILILVVTFTQRPQYTIYVWATLLLILTRFQDGPAPFHASQLESLFRYALLFFPCFIALGKLLDNWRLWLPYAMAAGQWQFFVMERFIRWIWVA